MAGRAQAPASHLRAKRTLLRRSFSDAKAKAPRVDCEYEYVDLTQNEDRHPLKLKMKELRKKAASENADGEATTADAHVPLHYDPSRSVPGALRLVACCRNMVKKTVRAEHHREER